MPDFTLDSSTLGVLGGSQFTTEFYRTEGEFQEIQLRVAQSGTGEDLDGPHWVELHFTVGGVTEE